MVPKKTYDVLSSSKVVRAEQLLGSGDVPPVVRDAHLELKSEIVKLRMNREIAAAKPKPDDSSTHPAVTGLSVGGAKEIIDYFLLIATESDPIGRDLLGMSFVDGGITAIIATVAAWVTTKPKKHKKK